MEEKKKTGKKDAVSVSGGQTGPDQQAYQDQIRRKAEVLKSIAHPIRLCLTRKLYERGSCNVSYFTDCMDASQSNISQHLGKMRDLGVLDCEKDGQMVNYFIKNDEVRKIIEVLFPESADGSGHRQKEEEEEV